MDGTNQHTCMYVCMPFSEVLCRSIRGDRHQQAPLYPSANQIPSEVVVSSDASLTLKGLSFRLCHPSCFLYVSSFRALLGYMLLDFITGKVQSISGPKWPPNV